MNNRPRVGAEIGERRTSVPREFLLTRGIHIPRSLISATTRPGEFSRCSSTEAVRAPGRTILRNMLFCREFRSFPPAPRNHRPASRNHFLASRNDFLAPGNHFLAPGNRWLAPENRWLAPETGRLAPRIGWLDPGNHFLDPVTGWLAPRNRSTKPGTERLAPATRPRNPGTNLREPGNRWLALDQAQPGTGGRVAVATTICGSSRSIKDVLSVETQIWQMFLIDMF